MTLTSTPTKGAPAYSTEEQSPPGPNYINHLQCAPPAQRSVPQLIDCRGSVEESSRITDCDDAYARLVLNPKIMRVVDALTGGNNTLVDTALTKMDRDGGVKIG